MMIMGDEGSSLPLSGTHASKDDDDDHHDDDDDLCSAFASMEVVNSGPKKNGTTLIVDVGYGFPNELRPRKEKIAAIAKQVTNFLLWQQQAKDGEKQQSPSSIVLSMRLQDEPIRTLLLKRMKEVWQQEHKVSRTLFPDNAVSFHIGSLESFVEHLQQKSPPIDLNNADPVLYLSPDADRVLSDHDTQPRALIIGGIIDRKHVQHGRSKNRSDQLGIPSVRWPLDGSSWDTHEPLNVDCVLQGLQLWVWTGDLAVSIDTALSYHTQRHPGRPQHTPRK